MAEPTKADLREIIAQHESNAELFQERLAELEFALEDMNWLHVALQTEREFSREGLRKIVRMARLMWLKNPLIRRSVNVQSYYVWGQGVNIQAKAPAVNEVIQRFLDDPDNRRVLTGHEARKNLEVELQLAGNVFLTMIPDRFTDRVRVRRIPSDEIEDIVTNPNDSMETWFYKRTWTERVFNEADGTYTPQSRVAYYPDWQYQPKGRPMPTQVAGQPVINLPTMQIKAGGLVDMRFGVPDVYAALDWAMAYKNFLEDWASIVRALQRFAWRLSTKGGKKGVAAAKKKMGTTVDLDNIETNPPATSGSTWINAEGVDLQPINKSGASIGVEDGKQIRLMVAAATDMPDTILSGDPQQGALATAKTLDRPTELAMRDRQLLWTEVFKDVLSFVMENAVRAPKSNLTGTIKTTVDGLSTLDLGLDENGEPISADFEVTFPSILEHDVAETVGAIVSAATLEGKAVAGTIPPRQLARMLLVALSAEDVDEIIDELFPENDVDQEPGTSEEDQATVEEQMVEAVRELRSHLERAKLSKVS